MEQQNSYESNDFSYEDVEDEEGPLSFADNDYENQKFIGQKSFAELTLSPQTKQYFSKFNKTSPKSFIKLFNFKVQVPQEKSVCAKAISRGETIAQCYDCATDSSCIQCMECFKNSNHEGHKVVLKKAFGGCCDCGDAEAWKKEGFCKKHTGESIDIQIDPKESELFVTQMKELFFLVFWQSIQNNENHCKDYSKKLLQTLCYLNQKGVYYNKLTCMVFGSKIPQTLIVSKNVNNRTILANILSPKVAKNLDIDKWMDLFFSMFQYYPFKKLLLSTYIKNFTIIYCDEESEMRGTSISCQLLTSYQLVMQYALDEGNVPLGSDIRIDKLTTFQRPFYVLYHDLEYITKLSGDTPEVYFRFHMRSRDGILKLFEYKKVIKNLQDKQKQEPDILQLARFVKHFQMQFRALEIVSKIAGILQKDKETLLFVIKVLYEEALKQQNEHKMIIFKPLTRALTLFLFAYFDLDLHNLEYQNNQEKINQFVKVFDQSNQSFSNSISKLFKTCVQSYLFHAKILAEPGLNSTLYVYIYCYKMKNHLISSVDILGVKMLSMFHNWLQVNKQPVISPQDYLWENKLVATEQAKKQELLTKIQNLKFILSELNLITASQSNQLYVAYDMNHECNLYQNYIEDLLFKIINQQKTSVTLPVVKEYQESFFHKNVDLSHNYLKKFCNFDKTKKAFVLLSQNQQKDTDYINYSDFRCNLTNKNEFQSPQKTLQLIKFSKSQHIFDTLWSIETIKKFVVKVIEFVKSFKTLNPSDTAETIQQMIDKFNPLFIQLMKIIYIKKMVTKKPEQLEIVLEFLRKVDYINSLINPFYECLLNPNKIEQEKEDNMIQKEKQLSPQKPTLEAKKSLEDHRKQKMKQKMQQKKKAIKQRYAKQLAEFQKQEKSKINQEEQFEQTDHKLNCIICKSEDQFDLIYLVNISYKNHEQLLGLGDGVTCLSIQSCYHPMDFGCYSKMFSEVANKKRPYVKCPFCKFRSNTFFPLLAQSKHANESIKKFQVAIFLEKNIDQISILQEIVKSFYHFALLAYLDPQRTLHRRLKIYRILLQILHANSKIYSMSEVYKKFITRTMNLNPKVFEQEEELKRSEKMLDLKMQLQNHEVEFEDLNEGQINYLLSLMGHSQPTNTGMLGNILNKFKEKINSLMTKSEEKQEKSKHQQKYTTIFKQTLRRLFKFLEVKEQINQQKSLNSEQKSISNPEALSPTLIECELSPDLADLQMCLNRLFDDKIPHQVQHQNSIYENFNENNSLLKLRDLPLNFKPLGKLNKCHFCEQMTPSMTLCLLCDWQGCLKNCLAQEKDSEKLHHHIKGGSFNHSKVHGEESLFLMMSKCIVAKISAEGLCESMGCIYKDEWGNDFNNKLPWESFFLDQGELNKIKLGFLHDA